jgi:hypothetical protein
MNLSLEGQSVSRQVKSLDFLKHVARLFRAATVASTRDCKCAACKSGTLPFYQNFLKALF